MKLNPPLPTSVFGLVTSYTLGIQSLSENGNGALKPCWGGDWTPQSSSENMTGCLGIDVLWCFCLKNSGLYFRMSSRTLMPTILLPCVLASSSMRSRRIPSPTTLISWRHLRPARALPAMWLRLWLGIPSLLRSLLWHLKLYLGDWWFFAGKARFLEDRVQPCYPCLFRNWKCFLCVSHLSYRSWFGEQTSCCMLVFLNAFCIHLMSVVSLVEKQKRQPHRIHGNWYIHQHSRQVPFVPWILQWEHQLFCGKPSNIGLDEWMKGIQLNHRLIEATKQPLALCMCGCVFVLSKARWWFQTSFTFTPPWGDAPMWLNFSNGLKQPRA